MVVIMEPRKSPKLGISWDDLFLLSGFYLVYSSCYINTIQSFALSKTKVLSQLP